MSRYKVDIQWDNANCFHWRVRQYVEVSSRFRKKLILTGKFEYATLEYSFAQIYKMSDKVFSIEVDTSNM